MKKLLAVAFLALSGCATPYSDMGLLGGVTAHPMTADVYRISAKLNAFSDETRVQDYLLLKAAEVAQSQGAVGFTIESSQDASRSYAYTTPGQATTNATVSGYGNTAYGTATTTYNPGQTYYGVKPGGIILIRLVREPVMNGARYISAAEIVANIGPRYKKP